MNRLGFLILSLLLILPRAAWADRAELMMIPTRVVMEDSDRYTTVIVKNIGNATGNFSADIIDMKMGGDGRVVPLEEGEKGEYSAKSYLRLAPRSFTLKPGTSQNIRIMLRKPEGLEAGEYRSHMRVKVEDDNVEATQEEAARIVDPAAKKETQVSVRAHLVLIIPVIFRTGESTLSMSIEGPKISNDSAGKPVLELDLLREGSRSSMGDFTVIHQPSGGSPQIIKTFPGIPVYRPLDRRHVKIPLDDMPADVNLSSGSLNIIYTAQEKDGGTKLTETTVSLPAR